MGHKKLIKFEAIKQFANVHEYPQHIAGTWHSLFNNNHPIVLELACGRGEYAVGLAQLQPHKNFIGIDIKGNRIWKGAKYALENNLANVQFVRSHIDQINNYFTENEIAEIWITFPDPQLRASKLRKRLTHPKYLAFYKKLLQPNGLVHLKTDSPDLYQFTKWVIELLGCTLVTDYDDAYAQTTIDDALKIKTYYESLDIAQSQKIHYLCFTLPNVLLDIDEALKEKVFTHAATQQAQGIDRR
jgi:tRNA (guanine-N7-)-methyltransferase